MEETDAAVIARSQADPAAFGALFDRHAAVLLRFLVRRVGPDTADGLLGECFRIAFEKRSTYDRDRPDARPWLYGIATRLVGRHRRSEARRLRATARLAARRAAEAADAGADAADRAAARVDARSTWPSVAEAVAALPDGERDVLLLHAWEALPYDEIAAALGIPVGTVRSRLNRARRRLRELAGGRGEEPVTTPPRGGSGEKMAP